MSATDSITMHIFDLDNIMSLLEEKKYPGEFIKLVDDGDNIIVRDSDEQQIGSLTKTKQQFNEEISNE